MTAGPSHTNRIAKSMQTFFATKAFLALFGLCLVVSSLILWQSQQTRDLARLHDGIVSKARSYASEAESRFSQILGALDRLSARGMPHKLIEADTDDWEQDARFYVDSFQGLEHIAWVDTTWKIQRVVPPAKAFENVGLLRDDWGPDSIVVWAPVYLGTQLAGFIVGVIDIPAFMAPVVTDTADDYMLQIANEGAPVFTSTNWQQPREGFSAQRAITLRNTAVWNLTLASTDGLYGREMASSRMTLLFSLCFVGMTLMAAGYAQRYSALSALNQLRLRKTLESMREGCQIVGADWRYRFVNAAAASLSERNPEELLGRTMLECSPDLQETALFPLLERCMDERTPQQLLQEVKTLGETTRWYELSIQPAPDGILILSSDVTESRRAELEIRSLNAELGKRVRDRTAQLEAANKELEAFAYSVSHDLRAPLRAMDGFSAALLQQYNNQLDEQGQHYLDRIQQASRRMGELIDDLLQLSRITRSDLTAQEVNLSAVAREIADELQAREPQRQAEFTIAPSLVVQGDARLLRIALQNLFENAWKFSARCAQTAVEIGRISPAELELRREDWAAHLTPEELERAAIYFVRDHGAGFDMAYAGKLFAPFQRLHTVREFDGTGIGLATVQRIVARHGGRIWAEAAVNEGASFYFTFGGKV